VTQRRNTIVGLDIGTDTVKAALGEINHPNQVAVSGLVEIPSLGLKKANIVDIELAAKAVETALNELEKMTGVEIMSAITGFSNVSISASPGNAVVALSGSNFEISSHEIEKVLEAAASIPLPADRAIVQVIERQYVVDGYEGVKDPLGMTGQRLEAEVVLISAAAAAVQNMQRSVKRINLQLDHLVFSQILAAEAVLLPAEKEMGVVLIDFGGGTTEISLFREGSLLSTSVLPFGADYITQDLAIILKTSREEAKRIKENYGLASPELAHRDIIVNVNNLQGNQSRQISQLLITEIISARILDMLDMIYAEIEKMTDMDNLAGGAVLTGGGAELTGMVDLLQAYLDIPVRLGDPINIVGLKNEYNKPQYSVVLGGLVYGCKNLQPSLTEAKPGVTSMLDKFNYWLKDLFA